MEFLGSTEMTCIGRVRIKDVIFDKSKRKKLDASILDNLAVGKGYMRATGKIVQTGSEVNELLSGAASAPGGATTEAGKGVEEAIGKGIEMGTKPIADATEKAMEQQSENGKEQTQPQLSPGQQNQEQSPDSQQQEKDTKRSTDQQTVTH